MQNFVFMWKMLIEFLPFPEILNQFGFVLLSKCQFYSHEEILNHTLSDYDVVTLVWDSFARLLGIPCYSTRVIQKLQQWWSHAFFSSARGN